MTYYDEISTGYNELYGKEQMEKWESAKRLTAIKGRVLDIGCGTGLITRKIENCIGVDSSIKLLEQAENTVVCGYAEKLPFKSESFDTIISFTALQDIKDVPSAVSELRRVLKKNGKILLSVLNKNKIKIIREVLKKNFKEIKEKEIRKDIVFFT